MTHSSPSPDLNSVPRTQNSEPSTQYSELFDPLAPTYDDDFTRSPIAQHLRARVHARLDAHVTAGQSALELGCGTGEDALHLARRGVYLTATDASPAMLAVAQSKLRDYPTVTLAQLNLYDLPRTQNSELRTQNFVFANFGVINCLSDWQHLARWLAGQVAVGGHVAFGVMSPLCAWETLWHAAQGDLRTATRRWRPGTPFTVNGAPLSPADAATQNSEPRTQSLIYYPTIRRLTRDFAPYFERVHVEPLGVFLPASDAYGAIEKRPRLLQTLMRLDDSIGRLSALALLADHYWIEFRRIEATLEP